MTGEEEIQILVRTTRNRFILTFCRVNITNKCLKTSSVSCRFGTGLAKS